MAVVPQVARRSQTITRRLEQAILEGRFRPRERLPAERTLAERWKVSRNTVREAITQLVARGLLIRIQGDGTYLNDVEQRLGVEIWSDMASRHANLQTHLLEFRQMLERRTAELAAQRHTADDRRRLLKAAKAVDATWLTQDREAQVEADMALHRVIAESAHNPVFSYLMASLQGVMRDHMKLTLAGNDETPSTTRAIREQHAALVAAILSGNAEAASASAGSHLDFEPPRFSRRLVGVSHATRAYSGIRE